MKPSLKITAILVISLSFGCSEKHLITKKEYRSEVEKRFSDRKELCSYRAADLFSVFDRSLSISQKEGLKFLYAYMPLNDLADYNGEFFLGNVDMSLRAKAETKWGNDIPEDIFLHYVLPCRVNNENLDSFRIKYYDEIYDRVKDKNIREAALEINHWCHEKVSYHAADIRTSAPMSTILSARGRCGEESTFTVAALRTAGIPARQVYTPRWAHSDDNHAWVEIWDKGNWYYMGACEPEPVLDLGWFTEPARRAMLVHTKSFGANYGSENVVNRYKNYTEVNNLAKYAVTKRIFVKVLDTNGAPLKDALVEYQLYNYSEYYPVAVVPTDTSGISQFETGLGDLLIWAHKGDNFCFSKISVSETDTLTMKLHGIIENQVSHDFDLVVPVTNPPFPGPSAELIEQNKKRVNDENILRQKYIDSWIKPEDAKSFALRIKSDTTRILSIFSRSMGNHKEIMNFLSETPDSLMNFALSMLEILADKDLRDTRTLILSGHLTSCMKNVSTSSSLINNMFLNYVLNPRIANEIVVDWRSYFAKILPSQLSAEASSDPSLIIKYLDRNINILNDENYYKTPVTPIGVFELKVSDTFSRSICFVAMCRSLGVPSRLEPGRNIPQYYINNVWNDVYFADQKLPLPGKGFVKLISSETKPVPEYYIHFTLARFDNGRYNTLEYDFNKNVSDFKDELSLPPGKYMIVTGNRLDDTKILSNISFFDLSDNEHKTIEIKLRRDHSEKDILGKIDIPLVLALFNKDNCSPDRIADKGFVILWIETDKEPTKHILNDLPLLKSELDSWGGYFLFLSDDSSRIGGITAKNSKNLPANSLFGTDNKLGTLKKVLSLKNPLDLKLPLVIMADKNGNIVFSSTGYRIGIGEQILKHSQ